MKKTIFAGSALAVPAMLGIAWFLAHLHRDDLSLRAGLPVAPPAALSPEVPVPSPVPAIEAEAPLAASPSFAELLGKAILSGDLPRREWALETRLRQWVREDAPGAAGCASRLEDAALRDRALRIVAQTWGQTNPDAAIIWAGTLSDEAARGVFLDAVCLGLGNVDPAAGTQLAGQLGLHGDGILENLTEQWAALDPGKALAWVYQRPAGLERDRLMQRIAVAEAQIDPARAASLVEQEIPPGSERAEAMISVVSPWARRDPASASHWVATFPAGFVRDRALAELQGVMAAR